MQRYATVEMRDALRLVVEGLHRYFLIRSFFTATPFPAETRQKVSGNSCGVREAEKQLTRKQ